MNVSYYKVVFTKNEELIAIHKAYVDDYDLWWRDANVEITKHLGTDGWWREDITQAEYETYQAFGIKEIKLCRE